MVMTLELKGKGALNLEPLGPITLEFRLPKAAEIAAGKTFDIPLKSLTSGFRGRSHDCVLDRAGRVRTGGEAEDRRRTRRPKGAKEGMDGFGVVTLTSAPFKLTVEEKK